MKLGYLGNIDTRVYVYIDNKKVNIYFRKTCYGSYKIYKNNEYIDEAYSLEEVYNKIKQLITK